MKKALFLLPLLLLGACNEQEVTMCDYVDLCVITQFTIDYESAELITYHTNEYNTYYLTDIYYRIEFENNVYSTTYISAVNSKNELVIKEITK